MIEIRKTDIFAKWIDSLSDVRARARILVRIEQIGQTVVVLLVGGDKRTQSRDIKTALRLAKNL